ncbi:PIN-like domain-containing protein, partial [Pseudomonas carnis]|uniref:PIN-like domain-containing protein n=2 Tax=Pseudomonas carnis TaxID=2487355 RepID=UPI0018E63DA5
QVGLEYHRRRLTIIKNEKKLFRDVNSSLDKLPAIIEGCMKSNSLSVKFPELNDHLKVLLESVGAEVSKCKEKVFEWDRKQPDVRSNDEILNKIDEFTSGKIGSPPENQDWLDDLFVEGSLRYANKTPPGFRDEEKSKGDFEDVQFFHNGLNYQRQYGDLILWRQLLEKASDPDIENVIFVTDDLKDDWWNIIDSGGDKHIGPHEGLKNEIYKQSNVNFFHMYSTSDFLRESKGILSTDISEHSIKDAHDKNEKLSAADFDVGLESEGVEGVVSLYGSKNHKKWVFPHDKTIDSNEDDYRSAMKRLFGANLFRKDVYDFKERDAALYLHPELHSIEDFIRRQERKKEDVNRLFLEGYFAGSSKDTKVDEFLEYWNRWKRLSEDLGEEEGDEEK